jgi:hypothetical protein
MIRFLADGVARNRAWDRGFVLIAGASLEGEWEGQVRYLPLR